MGPGSAKAVLQAKVVSVNLSETKGVAKKPVPEVELVVDLGVKGDAHAGPGDRQVSLLAIESVQRQKRIFQERLDKPGRAKRCPKAHSSLADLQPGSFAENITTQGLDIARLPVGTRLRVGEEVILEISRIGKECHIGCAIFKQWGDCVMPREGVFARVIQAGAVRPGDKIGVDESSHSDSQ